MNKIINGDAYKLIKELPDNSVDCIYTDIPYLYKMSSEGNSELSKRMEKRKKDLSKIINGIDFSIFDDFVRVLKKGNIFIWCSKLQIKDILNYFTQIYENFEILVWNKTNPSPTTKNTWLPDIEYCLYFREKGVKLNDGYKLKSKWFKSPLNIKDKKLYGHNTIKPLELVTRHILHTTQEGDVILDPFIGSGTTAVACKENNRKYIGFEQNKEYCKIAEDRVNGIDRNGQTSIFTKNLKNKGEVK